MLIVVSDPGSVTDCREMLVLGCGLDRVQQ